MVKTSRIDPSPFLLAAMVLLLVGGASAVYFSIRIDPMVEALSGDRIVNTLLVVEKDGKPITSSVLMYYPETKRAALFDIPGEMGQIIRSLGRVDRIDALYDGRRPDAYLNELASVLDADIPFFIGFDVSEISQLVDLMGGIEIFISDAVAEYGMTPPVLLPAGSIVLDGSKAVTYLRYEIEDEDESLPIIRRQRFLLSFLKRLGEEYQFLSSGAVRPFFLSLLHSNMSARSSSRLFAALSQIDVDRIVVQRIQGNLREVSGKPLLFPYYDGSLIKDIVKQTLASLSRDADGWSADRVYTVEVLNGTANQGMAKRTADLLQGFGFDTVKIGNADRTDYEMTTIISRSGDEKAARLLAEVIKCESIRAEAKDADYGAGIGFDEGVDFTLIIGRDFNGRFVVR